MVPEQITFANIPVHVGQVTLRTSEEETRMAFMVPGPDGQPASVMTLTRTRHVRREEVVAVRESVAERLRVTFIEEVSTVDTDGQVDRTVGPLAGNTFEVERKNGQAAVAVFDASGAPARFGVEERLQPVAAWTGPWPVDERWWDADQAVRAARFQIVGVDGSAWLLRVSDGAWCVEARYD